MPIQGEGMARIRLARAEEEASKNEHRLHERISELERKNALLAAESKRNYERGVQQATAVYTEVIREYVAENVYLRELVRRWRDLAVGGADSLTDWNHEQADLENCMRDLGIEVK